MTRSHFAAFVLCTVVVVTLLWSYSSLIGGLARIEEGLARISTTRVFLTEEREMDKRQRVVVTLESGYEVEVYRGEGETVEEYVERVQEAAMGPVKHTCWMSDGMRVDVFTPKKPNESVEVWCERHDSAVAALMVVYPKTGDC